MGYSGGPNQFPVFLKAQADGSVTAEIRRFEDFVSTSMGKVARSATQAAEQADKAFDFSSARKAIDNLEREMQRVGKLNVQRTGDPLGLAGSVASLRNSPLQRMLNEQASAEASLDAQRQRSHAQRISQIQTEFDSSISAIRARRAAEMEAIDSIIQRENSLVALEQQRAAEQARAVAGRTYIQAPGFDPAFAAQSAAAARTHAAALNQVAAAAEMVAAKEGQATATDRAYAATMRSSAAAADAEATRLEELAATQGRVAATATGLSRANLNLQTSQRGSRFATLQASQQFQDFFIQIGAGTNPLVAFTQQASQLAFVMSAAGGEAGKLARFMSGSGGTVAFALLAVIPLVGALVGKLADQNDEVDKATKKLREQADQLAATATAEDLWKNSIEGVIDAVRRQSQELDKALASQAQAQIAAVTSAQNNFGKIRDELEKTRQTYANLGGNKRIGDIRATIPQIQVNSGSAAAREGAVARVAELQAELSKLESTQRRITELQGALEIAGRDVTNAQLVLGRETGKAMADLSAQATRWNDLYSHALKGIIDNNPTLAPFADKLSFAVAKVNAAMQHAASVDVPFGNVATKAKELGRQLDLGQVKVPQFVDGMLKLAAALDAVAKAAEDARKSQGKLLTDFQLPVQGTITGRFGEKRPGHIHKGVDIKVPVGTPVNAAAAGTVIEVGTLPGFGNVVVIDHKGTITRYAHLSKFMAQEGQSVSKGQVIALSGGAKGAPGAGNSQGPHLHYEVAVGGKTVDPLKGKFPADEFGAGQAAQRAQEQAAAAAERATQKAINEQERLDNASEAAAEKVQRINEQWNEQPKLVDQAAQAHRALTQTIEDAVKAQQDYDALIQKLQKDKPAGWEEQVQQLEKSRDALSDVIAGAQAAGATIDEGMVRPLNEFLKGSREQAQIDDLILQGREDQADVMREILDLERQMGPLTAEQRKQVEATVQADRARKQALEEQERLISRAVRSANVVQDAITGVIQNPFDIKSYKSGLKSIMDDFRQNFARSISESLLGGDLGSQMEQALRAKSDPLGQAGSDLTSSASDLTSAASALTSAAATLGSAGGPSSGALSATPTAFLPGDLSSIYPKEILDLLGGLDGNTAQGVDLQGNIAALQQKQNDMLKRSALTSNPEQFYNMIGSKIGGQLDKALGTKFFEGIGGKLGTALEGAQIGQMSGQFLQLFGKRFQSNASQIGSSLGGGIGMLVGGPLGAIIGGLLGGLAGGLLSKKKQNPKGQATIGGDEYGNLDVTDNTGNGPTRIQESSKAANSVIDALEGLAEQLDVFLDTTKGKVSIGINGDDYRVDPTGQGRTNKDLAGILNFGSDAQGAIEAAIKDLINDGVLGPIKEGTKKLLLESRNLQAGLTKALKFENVFKELKQYQDPVGAAIEELDHQFDELRRIFAEAGASAAEYAQLEELYAFKRADAIKQATQQVSDTLQQLLKDLTYRGDTGLSLRTREKTALADLAPFQQAINAGQPIDQEAFARVVQSLLDIERQIYGSTETYFKMLSMLTALTQKAISNSGQPAVVPGVTPLPNGGTATPTANPPPLPDGSPSGAPVTAPAVPPEVAAANDNFAQSERIIVAINKQTQDLLAGGLDFNKMVSAIETAFVNMQQAQGEVFGLALKPLADQVVISNGKVIGTLNQILGTQQQGNEIAKQGFTSLGGLNPPTQNYSSDNYWEQEGAGMYFSPWGG